MIKLYPKLAAIGIKKNGRLYFPYILTCIIMVMMYYIISYMTYSDAVGNMTGGKDVQMIIGFGTGVIAVFSVIFLFYTSSFIIRRRKKEFGLYHMLGMGKKNIAAILLWENLFSALISLSVGTGLGILLSKLCELFTAKFLGESAAWGFSICTVSLRKTIVLYSVIFAVIFISSVMQVYFSKPTELIKSENVGEKPPKARWFMTAIGLLLLAGAYFISITIEDPMSALLSFFIAVIMVIVATYLLFISGSVALCKILQKNKRYYYKTAHFVSVSSMAYRMKRSGASLASICVLSTMVLVMISSTLCLYIGGEDSVHLKYPRDIIIETYTDTTDEKCAEQVQESADKILEKNNLSRESILQYSYLSVAGYISHDTVSFDRDAYINFDFSNIRQLFIITIDDYNRLMGENMTLDQNEIMIYTTKSDYDYDEITIDGMEPMKIKKHAKDFIQNEIDATQIFASIYLFVPDKNAMQEFYNFQKEKYGDESSNIVNLYGFNVNCDNERQKAVHSEIQKEFENISVSDKDYLFIDSKCLSERMDNFFSLFGGLLFLGILLSLVFICAATLIMYYKQIAEGYEDAGRFEIMQKVGMTKSEISSSINSQMLTVFIAPLLMAGLHTAFAFPIIKRLIMMFGVFNTPLLIGVTATAFGAFAIFYAVVYKITSKSYFNIVSK